ncbi:MAG: helix-turn-helix domain-containing protein [Bermanella sp.]
MKHQFIANVWINGLLNGFANQGIDIHVLTESLPDIDIEKIQQGQRVDVSVLRQIWHKAFELCNDPLLGFNVGRYFDLKGLGALAPLLMHSPTARISIENVSNFHTLISDSGQSKLTYEDDGVMGFHYTPAQNPIKESPHQVLALLTSMIYMGKFMHIQENTVTEIHLPDELDLELLDKKFRANVIGVKDHYSLWFKFDNLDELIPGTDSHFYHMTKSYVDELLRLKKSSNDLVASIKLFVIEGGYLRANVDNVTEQLGMNKRTLQRFLSEEKTSFRILKEEIIKEKSLSLIAQGKMSMNEIANKLGYSEVSAFHRAFKAWFGVTPKDFGTNLSIPLSTHC